MINRIFKMCFDISLFFKDVLIIPINRFFSYTVLVTYDHSKILKGARHEFI